MGIEPTSHALQAIEYTGFSSLVRVQLQTLVRRHKKLIESHQASGVESR